MPKRTSSHVIEDKSRRAFAALLPPEWVVRPVSRDYGIDEEVEVFEKQGAATGLMFFVQIKATAAPKLGKSLKICFKVHSLNYLRTLDLPVMIVRFHGPTGRFFWKWSHEFKQRPSSPDVKTVTLDIPPSAEWNDQTPSEIEASLRVFRQLKAAAHPHRIRFSLVISGPEVHGAPASIVKSALLKAASTSSQIVEITDDVPIGAHPEIIISNEKLIVSLAGLTGLTLNTLRGYPTEFATTKFPHDVLTAVACVLTMAGHFSEAAEIASNHLDQGTLDCFPEVWSLVLGAMARSGRVHDALRLARKLIEAAKGPDLIQALLIVGRLHTVSSTVSEFEYLHEVMRLFIKKATELNDNRTAAVAHYNLGNLLRSQGQPYRRAAFREYRLAAASDPGYRQRSYFWNELAGILFLAGHFRSSTTAYRKAVELGGDVACTALLADSLMFSGKYREAREAFREYIRLKPEAVAEWHLKAFMLARMQDTLGIEDQRRNPRLANMLADVTGLREEEVPGRLEAALQADALCSYAWYNLGADLIMRGKSQEGFISYLFAAVCRPGDIEAWCLALLNSLNSQQNATLTILSAQMAYRCNGHSFLEGLHKLTKQKLPNLPITDLMNAVGEAVKNVDGTNRRNMVRILGEGANFEEVFLGDDLN
jgi:hypothetical protein